MDRVDGVEYSVDHWGDRFVVLTNLDAPMEKRELTDAGADADAGDAGAVVDAAMEAAAPPPPKAERPIRVVTLGWELASPAATLGDGGIEVAPEPQLDALGARLARGGVDPAGADIAVMPLPAFVTSYEKLRALDPKAFLVVGFSRGREELHAATGAVTKPLNPAEEVKLVALAPSTTTDANARASGTDSATVFGLFAMDLLGAPPSRVRFLASGSDAAKGSPFAAIAKGASDERKLVMSTADASRFVPIVAVAPKAVLDDPRASTFAKAWIEALGKARTDAAGVARRLATKDGVALAAGTGGAPEAVTLLEQLGTIEPISMADEAVWVGSGRAVALDTLMAKTWSLARGGGLSSIAAPEPLPIDVRIVSAIAPKTGDAPKVESEGDAGAAFAPVPTGSVVLVVYRAPSDATSASVAQQIAFLSGVFERASFRITAKGGEKAARALATEASKSVPRTRLATAAGEPPTGVFASVEILGLP